MLIRVSLSVLDLNISVSRKLNIINKKGVLKPFCKRMEDKSSCERFSNNNERKLSIIKAWIVKIDSIRVYVKH